MDANELLKKLRVIFCNTQETLRGASDGWVNTTWEAMEMFADLDKHLSDGGELPDAWRRGEIPESQSAVGANERPSKWHWDMATGHFGASIWIARHGAMVNLADVDGIYQGGTRPKLIGWVVTNKVDGREMTIRSEKLEMAKATVEWVLECCWGLGSDQ